MEWDICRILVVNGALEIAYQAFWDSRKLSAVSVPAY